MARQLRVPEFEIEQRRVTMPATGSAEGEGSQAIDARLVKRFAGASDSEPFELNVHIRTGPGITVFLGPSGAGKSLTLNCLAGFARPDEGRILVHDEIFFDAASNVFVPPQERHCGYIFQDHALFPHMSVRENLRFGAEASGARRLRARDRHRRLNELLESFELAGVAARKPGQLSGGQKQRAALARILASEPRLLLLDEPTRGLDARLRRSFYELLHQTRQRLHAPVLLVTHDVDECLELAGFICLMDRGRVLQAGPKDSVLARPATTDVARLLGIYNIIPATISALDPGRNSSRLRILDTQIEGPYLPGHLIGDHGFVCVRESELKLALDTGKPDHKHLRLCVERVTSSSHGLRVQLEQGICAVVSETTFERLRAHDFVHLEIPPAAVYFVGK